MSDDNREPPKPLTAHTTEQGTAQSSSSSWWALDATETNPELRWPNSVAVYELMRRSDAQCASVLRGVTLPIRRTTWRLDPAGADPEVVQLVAEDLGLPVVGQTTPPLRARTRGRFSWAEHLQLALLMLPFGHMFFEQIYRIEGTGANARARLRKLGPRMPRTISEIKVAADGGLEGIRQHTAGGTSDLIKVENLVAYVHDREGANWIGTSLLRPAYKHWLIKDRLLRVQAQTIDRNGMGVPRYTGAEKETNLDPGKQLAASWRSGDAAGASIPYGAKLDLVGVTGTIPDALPVVQYHDGEIARSVLAHFLNLGQQSGTGSWALGTTLGDFFRMSLQAIGDDIADVATQHIVEDLVDLNFGQDALAPRIVLDPIDSDLTAAALKTLVDAGLLTPDEATELFVRTRFHLPTPQKDTP